jgi:hypothetical protein
MPQPHSANQPAKPIGKVVTKNDYLALAGFLQGSDSAQRVYKKDPNGEAVRTTAEFYGNRDYVAAFECFKPAYDKVVGDMQRVLARNLEFEANSLARKQQVSLAVAKERIQNIRAHAQQVMDQFQRLLNDLESKPLVRAHLKKRGAAIAVVEPAEDQPPPTTLSSASETRVEAVFEAPAKIVIEECHYTKAPYVLPEKGFVYSVRDKAKGERIIRVISLDTDGEQIQVEILEEGKPSKAPIQLAVDLLAKQAAKNWCSLLVPVTGQEKISPVASGPANAHFRHVTMRLDSQNFARCCGDIVRANLKFSTQAIKDVADGPFRAGNYEQAFLVFEQIAVGFNSAVANSRREISEGRRLLSTQKFKLSGKEILERTAAFVRSENLIQTAEREFSTILEGLRMYLRVQAATENQDESGKA